jgi:hypothetical protein
MKKYFLFTLQLTLFSVVSIAQNFTGGYNFVLPGYDTTTQNVLLPFANQPAITNNDFITTAGDKFYKNGAPYRFWGGNVTVQSNFPEVTDAPLVAGRLKKMGVNLVRFHHLDNNWGGNAGSIFVQGQTTRVLNTVTLNKMDYFINELKKNGIYVNMNLNVSRTFNQFDGVPNYDQFEDFAKGLTIIDSQLIALQKEYATQILDHVNPYTGLKLSQDPVLAMVEMINENSLYGMYRDSDLRLKINGGKLQQRHQRYLDSAWNKFLVAKYTNQTNLATAWQIGLLPPSSQMLADGAFEGATLHANWQNEQHNGAAATIALDNTTSYTGAKSLKLTVNSQGSANWNLQFKHVNLTLQKDSVYIISFFAKGDNGQTIGLSVTKNTANYDWYGGANFIIDNTWKEYKYTITASATVNNDVRISFSFGTQTGNIWLDDVSMRKRYIKAFEAGEDLGLENIARINYNERQSYSAKRNADLSEFIIGVQKNFMESFSTFLKTDLNIVAPITGTNALSGVQEASAHANLDFYDDHNYWDHPWFPAGWSTTNWSINNTSASKRNAVEAMTHLFSGVQLNSKPFTMSEFNHSFPNIYRTEMLPLVTAYGSFNGMDGLMFFELNGEPNWNDDFVPNFFSLVRDNAVMSLFPSCAVAYRNGYITEGTPVVINHNADSLYHYNKTDDFNRWGRYLPYDKRITLTHNLKTGSYNSATQFNPVSLPTVPTNGIYNTTTNQIELNTNTGILKVNTPKFKAIGGFLNAGGVHAVTGMRVLSADGFAQVSWITNQQNRNLEVASTSLLTIATRQQNNGMIWNGTNTTINGNWGAAPTSLQPINISIELTVDADQLEVIPLNSLGKPNGTSFFVVANNFTAGLKTFTLNLNTGVTATPWYAIRRIGGIILAANKFTITGTPSANHVALNWGAINGDVARYTVEVSTNGSQFTSLALGNNATLNYKHTNAVQIANTLFYRIKASLANGTTEFSNTLKIDFLNTSSFLMYPNPVNNGLQIVNNKNATVAVLTDFMGRQIKQFTLVSGLNSVQLPNLPAGSYNVLFYNAKTLLGNLQLKK